jgi:hypothetical protein
MTSPTGRGDRRQLIVYATPTGPLAEQIGRYFDAAADLGATVAQTYPPHCTLTGFFWRRPAQVPRVVGEFATVAASTASVAPVGSVEVTRLGADDSWVGLELASTWLTDFTRLFAQTHQLDAGDDALRRKSWLHLSLAYGLEAPESIEPYRRLAHELIDIAAPVEWQVGLFERNPDGSWIQH